MIFAVFDDFRPILMGFIDQNMRIHDFSMVFCQKSNDSGPDFVQKKVFGQRLKSILIFAEFLILSSITRLECN